ncbi:MAG: ferrous iron transport protein A [Clostridiales bacterium]|nr:ferrous iron transport protein A [Clostridiales bacterium]
MPLAIAPINTELRVVKILMEEKTKRHLENLGVTINSVIRVISHNGGNVICIVKDGRVALDKDISKKILVA